MLLILIYRLLLGVNLPKKIERVDCYAGDKAPDLFLARTDILICMLPLTDATRDILNLELFRRLKPNAYIMNLGRGEHLVEESKISEKTINPNRIKSLGISPLALPMIVGPAAIVMVILY
ncbi:NAD(P)-dependent oxidoreductase [Aquella oligotrophica]|uniref:D-isomer specific 2-hydroxyacid dehydrogenase NAD-binding domain-containing protein n=1 Tax=Aquella oligotrophica TaxID=2067065 RepID=A0A2I7N8A2_9NEIS|nr:NAD(P)-dependent oxidoreductase [Aquella oligotrophica]AUR52693.1 hypothetical protein CUN60_10425 [Aquella oligotrophica]